MQYHNPVLLNECIEGLQIDPHGIYVDVTFGGGGHSSAILGKLGEDGKLIGFDQDPDAAANKLQDKRFVLVRQNFRVMKSQLKLLRALPVKGILADLGISSHQIDVAERGFSTRFEGELDMRMDRSSGKTAAEVLNNYPEKQLAGIFRNYGEVENASKLARLIVEKRKTDPFKTISQLKDVLKSLARWGKENQYYAKVFQGLRIEVNDEINALKEMLEQAMESLDKGGRLVVISYHSLEDRLVKNFMRSGKFEGEPEKDFYGNLLVPFKAITKKPIVPSEEEIEKNNRARSAKLRIAEKL